MFRIAASPSGRTFQDIVTSRIDSRFQIPHSKFDGHRSLESGTWNLNGTLPREQLDESPAIGSQLGGADPRHFRQGFERTGPERSDRRERAIVEDDVRRDG